MTDCTPSCTKSYFLRFGRYLVSTCWSTFVSPDSRLCFLSFLMHISWFWCVLWHPLAALRHPFLQALVTWAPDGPRRVPSALKRVTSGAFRLPIGRIWTTFWLLFRDVGGIVLWKFVQACWKTTLNIWWVFLGLTCLFLCLCLSPSLSLYLSSLFPSLPLSLLEAHAVELCLPPWIAAWSRPREAWPKTTLAWDSSAGSWVCLGNVCTQVDEFRD